MPNQATLWVIGFAALFIVRPWEVLISALEPLRLESIALIVLFARFLLVRDAPLRIDRASAPLLLFTASLLVVSITSWDWDTSYQPLERGIKIAVFALCLLAALRTPADIRGFVWGWVGINGLYMAKSIWEYTLHGRGVYRMGFSRLIGIEDSYGDPNTYASRIVVLIPFLVLLFTTTRNKRERWLIGSCFGLAGATIILTGSRGALLGAAFTGFLYLMFSRRRAIAIGVVAAAVLVGVAFMPDAIRERYGTLIDPSANESATVSAEGRLIGFKKGIHLFRERPLVGIGPGVFPTSSEHTEQLPYEVVGLQPHNLIGQMLGETGLVGTFAFLVLLLTTYAAALRMKRIPPRSAEMHFMSRFGATVAYSTTLLLFMGIPSHNLYNYQWLWLSALGGAGATVRLRRPTATSSKSVDPVAPVRRPRRAASRRGPRRRG